MRSSALCLQQHARSLSVRYNLKSSLYGRRVLYSSGATETGVRQPQQRMSTTAGAAAAAAPSTGGQNAAAPSNEQQQAQQQQQQQPNDPIVQWVVLRRDLWGGASGWPLGPIVAQACHASAAALFAHLDDPDTQAYVAPNAIDGMHKVVLEVKTEAQLRSLSGKLEAAGVAHKLWVEQPEDVPTALATKPYRRSAVAQHFKKLQLCKAAVGGAGGGGNGGNGGGGGGGTTSGGE